MRHHGYRPHLSGRPSSNGTAPRRKVVLVVEDHGSVGGLIAGLIRQDGYRAVRAWDTGEALRLARGRRPDLLLLDLNLAYDGGLKILRELRGNEATRRVPLLVVAGPNLGLASEEQALVHEVVRKPFDIDLLLNAVRKALGDPVLEVQPRPHDLQDHFLHGY